ncbi:alpha/beta fold hydrolase [Celeribacter sp.]|uniref:alpha/beta fold hydrolase n=1 Tax=Celeribacter sp. TaxID=1890673 RepID=UPI003A900CEE
MNDVKLYSTISGPRDAPALLLLNSLGATQSMWDDQISSLERRYRLIRCDTRGHGQSPIGQGPYVFDDLVADALAVLETHEVEKATIVGLSLGGMTALGLGVAAPQRVERIVCCAARADAPPMFVQSWHNRLDKLDEGGIEAVWQGTVGSWLSDDTRATRPEAEELLKQGFLQTTEDGYRGCAHALMGLDYLRHLGGLNIPTAFIAGERDVAASPETMKGMADACPGSDYIVVPDAKHLITVDNPQGFGVALCRALLLEC